MRRSASAVFTAGLLLSLCGCALPVGIAYPTLSYTPSIVTADESVKDMHAFRVTFVEQKQSVKQDDSIKCDFAEIERASNGDVPGQKLVGMSYHWAIYFLPGNTEPLQGKVHTFDKWVRVRLYRRGYKMIEIGPAHSSNDLLDWQQAESDIENEEAIDALVGVKKNSFKSVRPGSASESHKAFLEFARVEYEQLANSINEDSLVHRQVRWRLLHKAAKLRARAAE